MHTSRRTQLFTESVIREMTRAIPTFLLLVVPVFAFGLKLFYLFCRRLYFDHFVFACHFYSFWLLLLSISVPLHNAWVWSIGHGLVAPVYLFLALRRVYKQHWFMTIFKMVMLGFWQIFSAVLLIPLVVLYAFFHV